VWLDSGERAGADCLLLRIPGAPRRTDHRRAPDPVPFLPQVNVVASLNSGSPCPLQIRCSNTSEEGVANRRRIKTPSPEDTPDGSVGESRDGGVNSR